MKKFYRVRRSRLINSGVSRRVARRIIRRQRRHLRQFRRKKW